MKALILTISTGQGHNSAARAICEELTGLGWECDTRDSLGFISGLTSSFLSNGHSRMYKTFPGLFRRGYNWLEKHPRACREGGAIYHYLGRGARELRLYLEQGQFNVIICTHIFAGLMLTEALRQHPLDAETVLVATDYTCSPGTVHCRMDRYAIPHPELAEEFMDRGLPREKLVCRRLPVRSDFLRRTDTDAAKETLGIAPDHRHLLIMCGSMGCGPLKSLARRLAKGLSPDQEMTIVCGTNKPLYKKLSRLYEGREDIHILGYREDVSLLMDSADLYLTKPGGISVSEAAAKRLPMVLMDVVEGCEKYNLRFFLSHDCAATARSNRALARLTLSLLEDREALGRMKQALTRITAVDEFESFSCDQSPKGA